MRRVLASVSLGITAMLGLGAGYVAASKPGAPGAGVVKICHSGDGKHFTEESPSPSGILNGHADHRYDVIPPFEVVGEGGKATHYPGKNLSTGYRAGYPGAEVLANRCKVPSIGGVTETTATHTTETLRETVTEPELNLAGAVSTTTTVVVDTFTGPTETVMALGATTVVTVPAGQTTTVTVPANTVTIPPSTVTAPGGVLVEPSQTVTVPGTTQTVTAAAATVVTLTAPNIEVVRGGMLDARLRVPLLIRRPPVHLRARVVHVVVKHRTSVRVIVIVRRSCPPGFSLFHGGCSPIVHGRG